MTNLKCCLQKPKVGRIVVPTANDVGRVEEEAEYGSEDPLIEDIFLPAKTAIVPIEIKYWPERGGGVECFEKLPYNVLPQLTKASGTSVVLEAENRRIRVSGSEQKLVDQVMGKLYNLEKPLVMTPLALLSEL